MLLEFVSFDSNMQRLKKKGKRARKSPRFWVKTIFQQREELGEYHRLVGELRRIDRKYFLSKSSM